MKILVDVSMVVEHKFKLLNGITRVSRSVLCSLLPLSSNEIKIFPVYYDANIKGYKSIDNFLELCSNNKLPLLNNNIVEAVGGDVFLGLDLNWNIILQTEILKDWKKNRIGIYFVVYDLLPILYPECFESLGYNIVHRKWLSAICQFDGVFCISKSVMGDLKNYLNFNLFDYNKKIKIDWFHLGADLSYGLQEESYQHVNDQTRRKSNELIFLMVGTIEPRKSHDSVLSAFQVLWDHNVNCVLIIVGKVGWSVTEFITRLKSHPQYNKKIFWFESVNDLELSKLYSISDCYIAASLNEGFGLPIIEAASHGLPVIARDIPVFREIGSDICYFYKNDESLAQCIYDWISLFKSNEHKKPEKFKWLTWKESSTTLLNKLLSMNQDL